MDEVKALVILERKSSIPLDGESFDTISEAYDVAIEALEKQIPKQPKSVSRAEDCVYVKCPTCNLRTVLYNDCTMDYCKNCGQRLDFSEK